MAEPTPTPTPEPTPTPPAPTDPTPPTPAQSFTQADIDAAVAAAVEKARKGWDKEQSEAKRLAKLSADERAKEENRIESEKLQSERASFEREKLEFEAAKQLKAIGISERFASRVCGKDADETKANIDAFASDWNIAITAGIDERLKGSPPKIGGGEAAGASMADIIAKSVKQGF